MKRLFFILWITLVSGGWLMANHWTPNSMSYENNMTLTGLVRIDGIEQQTTALEVGAFCGDECRGSALLSFFPPTQRYVVQLLIYGNTGDQITFRLYDHDQNEELDLITYDNITITSDGYGSLTNPYVLNFYTASPGPYSITVSSNPEAGGTVTGSGTYSHGATATLTAMANEDYRFVNWTKDGEVVSSRASFSFVVTEAGNYVANFELSITHHWVPTTTPYEGNMTLTGVIQINGQEQYNPMLELGVFCGAECRGSGAASFFAPMQRYVVQVLIYGESGEALTFRLYDHEFNEEFELYPTHAVTFTPDGYGSLVNPRVINFTESATAYHAITAITSPEGSGTIAGTGTYLNGTTCTLTTTANDHYQFVNWTENGIMVSTSNTYAFEVTSERTFVANFVPVEGNYWTPNAASYSDNMTLTGIVQINSVEQQTTALEVGVFCNEECRGAGRLAYFPITQRYVIQLVVYGNEGDQLTFKLYDHALGQELNLNSPDAVVIVANGYGSLFNPYVLNFTEILEITQTTNLSRGWNWYSTYIEQEGIDGLGQLENSIGVPNAIIQSQNDGYVKSILRNGRVLWGGTLTSINNEEMYKIGTKYICSATMEGVATNPAEHPITINKGWNWIGFPCDHSVSVSEAFSGFTPRNKDVIKGLNSYATYRNGTWVGTLNTLEPGQGYMYGSKDRRPKTLVYQSGRGEATLANITPENNYYQPTDDYADNMTLTAVIELDGEELHSEDYELAAFVGDECRGSVKLMYVEPINRYVAFLTVFGDETEDMHFVLTDGVDMSQSDDYVRYETDGMVGTLTEPVTLRFGTLGLGDGMRLPVHIYPNPSKDVFNIEGVGIRKVEVTNAYGQVILSKEVENDNLQIDLSGKAAGAYLLRVVTDRGVATKKLIKE